MPKDQITNVEINAVRTEGDQMEKMLSPSEEHSSPVSNDTSAPLDFSTLTPCQFGISVQSFAPASLPNPKDKSRLAQIKARRRSNIGVRGSPETNSLIRFMAQHRMKTPKTFQTPELVRNSPFLPRVASTLRQKMACFQNLMDVEESEVCGPVPRQDSNTEGCIKTRDYLSDGNSCDGGKENHPPLMTPTPSKRRRLGPQETCKLEIRETSALTLHFSLKEQEEDEEPATQAGKKEQLPSSETVEEAQAVLISPPLFVDSDLQACSPPKNQQDCIFELKSHNQAPPDDPAAVSQAQFASSFRTPSLPALLEMKPTVGMKISDGSPVFEGEDDATTRSTVKNKKKTVRFGAPLSPEFFDKNLPPSTPLQKGGTPARAATPGGGLQPRSVLKTPQRSESKTAQAQPNFSSPTAFGASPTLVMPHNHRMLSVGEDSDEKDGKIVFPSMEEADSALTLEKEFTWDTQPLNLNTAFHEESLSQMMNESENKPSTASQMDAPDDLTSLPEQEEQPEAVTGAQAKPRNQRKKQPGSECESTIEAPAHPNSRKRKKPEESEPVKRSTRSAAKSACGKMKMTSASTRRWNKDVDRSLYGSRAYASKNPTLSPITERLSFISQSPAVQHTPSASCTEAPIQEIDLNPGISNDSQVISDSTVTNALKNPSDDPITSSNSGKESTTGKGRRLSGSRVRGRGLKKRKVSVPGGVLFSEEAQDLTREKVEEHCADQSIRDREASRETSLTHTVPEQGGVDSDALTSPDAHCTDLDKKLKCNGDLDAPCSDYPPSAEESNRTLSLPSAPAQRKAKRGRRSSVNSSVQEQGNQVKEHQTSHDVKEKEQEDQAASQQESMGSGSDSQEEMGAAGAANLDLAPWQADFNFEDVFKPVATRGQRSVRRSLRNQSVAEHSSSSAGLAWLSWTSPESGKEARRRTRGRRLSSAGLPVQPSLPEETQENAS